ncbi:hypothetical protein [Amaricoccus macauensis]|uniref:hypothetical protein n=1 Tax=Amaricoccus macauensis TaxID=57001 RepID=UPI003C7D196A
MKPIYEDPEHFDAAVTKTAESFISRFGKEAGNEAWKAARHPSMTEAEKAYCEAVAVKVVSMLRTPAE